LSALAPFSQIAGYGLAVRICTVLLVPLGVINAAFIPLAVHARATGDEKELRRLVDRASLASSVLAASGYVIFAVAGYPAVQAWSPSFSDAYVLVLILGLGKVFHACGGSAGVILMTWGDQASAMSLTLVSGLVTLGACVVGYMTCGLLGLALAIAFGDILQTTLFIARVRMRFGIDPSLVAAIT
jgi:O-antigen/teichoic acid export membrane protein